MRDYRDQSFATQVIAKATRMHLSTLDRRAFAEMHERDAREIGAPSDERDDIAASNARQDAYWKRVGGHPDAGHVDGPDEERCAYCGAPLDCDPEPNHPYCSTQCAIDAENDR